MITQGTVRVLEYDTLTNQWVQQGQYITGEIFFEHIGRDIALSSDSEYLAIGSNNNYTINGVEANAGICRVFKYHDINQDWEQVGSNL